MSKNCIQYELDDIHRLLLKYADEKYRSFSARLLPPHTPLIGVRLPILRQIAKQGIRQKGILFLKQLTDDSFEEKMLSGFVIGYVSLPISDKIPYIENYLNKVDNWSLCDSFCATFCLSDSDKKTLLPFLKRCLNNDKEYVVRFGVVMLLMYYITETDIDMCLKLFERISHQGYYVQMAVAWAVSICYIQYSRQTLLFLQKNTLNKYVQNKAIQKIRESVCVSQDKKDFVLQYKKH